MCGIAGFIGSDARLDEAMLRRMLAAQRHRGPDDVGVLFRTVAGVRVGMAHNRLSVQDLSSAGHQPMADDGETCWICYNGEFYNSPGIRAEMQARGQAFRSTSDTEVLLYLCRDAGVESALPRVNGMFAFGFYDQRDRSLHLVRDRAGQKPLFYVVLPDGSLVYASELPALLATGLVARDDVDAAAVDQYWTLGYTAGERTFYRGIQRLRPGSLIRWRDGRHEKKRYWQVTFEQGEDSGRPIAAYADELSELLQDAVKLRLLADVPVGICLSSGIDSSLMAAMIARLRADVPAYTIAFEGTPADEAVQAGAIARHLGIDHHILNVSGDMARDFPAIAAWYGEPFGDASSIPMYYLSKMIREHATVALTGDGGDELFAGYHHYRDGVRLWGKASTFNAQHSTSNIQGLNASWIRSLLLGFLGVERGYVRMQRHANDRLKKRLYQPSVWAGRAEDERRAWLAASRDPLAAMQNCDFHVYMTDDVHTKVDRMSMAHALECRSPFMDYRIIEWAARLPSRVKLGPDGRGKLVLRELLGRFMPRELFDRPKQGFTPPWEVWCAGELRRHLRLDWNKRDDALMRRSAIDRLVPETGPVSPILSWMAFSYVEWRKHVNHG